MLRKKGKVVSTKMQKTAVVEVKSYRRHSLYKKVCTFSSKLFVHDPEDTLKDGDFVEIEETRPHSKKKTWSLIKVLHSSH
jgi:small subunit ribosomal protein S17